MSFWERIREKLGGDGDQPSTAYHIVDLAGLATPGGRTSPRERVALLQKLAQFAEREKLNICALVEGRPLREAPDGEPFRGMTVYYAETLEHLSDRVRELVRSHGSSVLVTHRRELEEWASQNGVPTLRTSSLRRGMDENGGGGRGGDPGRSGGQRGRNRRPQRSRRSSGGNGGGRSSQGGQQKEPQKQASPPAEAPKQDGVSDLIDLV